MSEDKRKSVQSVVIYGAVLFAVAALLVAMSLLINVKNTKRLEDEMDETNTRTQTTLMNVQEENETLKQLLEDANKRIEELEKQNAEYSSTAEINDARITSLDAIAQAGRFILNGRYTAAREQLELVNVDVLTEDELAAYKRLYNKVN